MIELDRIDAKILSVLQSQAGASQRIVADEVGLSQNACWRRMKRLSDAGLIEGSFARINPRLAGLELTIFVMIRTRHHGKSWSDTFRAQIEKIPEVIEFHRIGGEWDYMAKVVTTSMAGYDRVYRQMIADIELENVTGYFSMETIFESRPLPIPATR